MLHVKAARYIEDYKIWVSFDDGTSGEIDLEGELNGPVFEPLKDKNTFSKFSVDPELDTIIWSNGADLSPEYLKEKMYNKANQKQTN